MSSPARTTDDPAVILQISDTHIAGPDGPAETRGELLAVADRVRTSGLGIDAIVVSGDIADDGHPEAYRFVRETIGGLAAEIGALFVPVIGNHDLRGPFREVFFGGDPADDSPLDGVAWCRPRCGGPVRIIRLDTVLPGSSAGQVTPEQLAWLGDVLAEPAPGGSVLVMHHPPVPSFQLSAVPHEWADRDLLAPVIADSDVRIILSGHVHLSSVGFCAGRPVAICGALSGNQDALARRDAVRTWDGNRTVNVVLLFADQVLINPASVREFPTVQPARYIQRRSA